MGFQLHPQLQADCIHIKHMELSDLLLMNDSRFPWLILVPRVADVSEMFDLAADKQTFLHQEIISIAHRLKKITHADKINIAALGNQVAQLHIHIIARFKTDEAWPKPVWGSGVAKLYDLNNLPSWIESFNA